MQCAQLCPSFYHIWGKCEVERGPTKERQTGWEAFELCMPRRLTAGQRAAATLPWHCGARQQRSVSVCACVCVCLPTSTTKPFSLSFSAERCLLAVAEPSPHSVKKKAPHTASCILGTIIITSKGYIKAAHINISHINNGWNESHMNCHNVEDLTMVSNP